jgi:predicted TIM-barrel fold metal-dependent hydrolase
MPAGLEIIDCHHHLWDLKANYYPWLTDKIGTRVCGDYAAIRKNYLLEDLFRDAAGLNLIKSVHIQAEHDPTDPVRETRWLQAVADRADSKGFPHGIVAYANLADPTVEPILEAHCQFRNVRGIRQLLHEALLDPKNPGVSPLENPTWRKNLGVLRRLGLSFDLQVFPQQMAEAVRVVREHPGLQFILVHTGQPIRRDAEGVEQWRRGMHALAECPNVCAKISGLGMFDRTWTVESLRPFVLGTIDAFGPDRCLFASNFPVDSMMSGYRRLWGAYATITAGFSDDERRMLFSGNAQRVYRL